MRTGGNPPKQTVGALGLFGGAPDDAAHQKELRIVASMPFAVDRFHANTPEKPRWESRTRSTSARARNRWRPAYDSDDVEDDAKNDARLCIF
jgi:hypothetical protein